MVVELWRKAWLQVNQKLLVFGNLPHIAGVVWVAALAFLMRRPSLGVMESENMTVVVRAAVPLCVLVFEVLKVEDMMAVVPVVVPVCHLVRWGMTWVV